ncbi:high mobility group protein B3-like [Sciurus carolinensis]|uniref:high mobility group protein B3-like n=1 Tax=Sciurus carolinensis TaxID=30640 RepID=UPI001FB4C1BB|nr:high mobility group protein B3-like [Sciurus carolinensis]
MTSKHRKRCSPSSALQEMPIEIPLWGSRRTIRQLPWRQLVGGTVVPCTALTSKQYRWVAKGDPRKPKGKMSAYAVFVETCREEHKRNPEVPGSFAEFSKKCSERWKTMSGKEKSKFDEMAKADKVRCDQEMKDYGPAKGGKKKKDLNAPQRSPPVFFLFCSEFRPKIKSIHPGISIGDTNVAKKLGEMWNNLSDSKKQPYITQATKLKEKYEKDVADCKSKGKFEGTKGPAKVAQKKVEEEDKEEEEGE